MNYYEHTLIARQELAEKQLKNVIQKYQEIISKNSGKIIKIEEWGLMNLARLIKKNKKGIYIHFKFEGNGKTVQELEKNERIDIQLLRFLTVRVKKFDLKTEYFSNSDSKKIN